MSIFQEIPYTKDISKVVGVQFSVASPDEIKRRSVAEIITHETYDGDIPKIGGLFDPRMGVLDHGKICPTDELDNRECPGYFGHIELAKPVFHYQYLKYIIKTLGCVCTRCSKLLISPSDPEMKRIVASKNGVNRFLAVAQATNKIRYCGERNEDGCNAPVPQVIKKDPQNFALIQVKYTGPNEEGEKSEYKQLWDAGDVLKILKRVSDVECEAMGFSRKFCRPDWLICSVLPVAPPTVRPSVRQDNNTRSEDDLTHKYCDIIKINRELKKKIMQDAPKKTLDDLYSLLQHHVITLVDNSVPGVGKSEVRTGRPLKSIKDRLSAKDGRVRGNLMGKRTDFSARSVITPDTRIKISELGVPEEIAMNLTIAEKVNRYNKEKLTKLVRNGYDHYPGAKSIKRKNDGQIFSLKVGDTTKIELEEGDIVNRHLLDGDKVLFNRQPSLHKMSMMCHTVRVLPYSTFRLNPVVVTPYNADSNAL